MGKDTPIERFYSKVMPEPMSGCWIWLGCLFDNGYGVLRVAGHNLKAHRFSYQIHNGEIKGGLVVRHTCDNKWCVNPDHLIVGTMKDNVQDSVIRGRKHHPKGELHGQARLTNTDVLMIRSSSSTKETIAKHYNISRGHLNDILNRKKWTHI